jgi:hypothetical protein
MSKQRSVEPTSKTKESTALNKFSIKELKNELNRRQNVENAIQKEQIVSDYDKGENTKEKPME